MKLAFSRNHEPVQESTPRGMHYTKNTKDTKNGYTSIKPSRLLGFVSFGTARISLVCLPD